MMLAIALFLFVMGILSALVGGEAAVAAIFVVGGWLVFAMNLAVEKLERR